MARAGTDGSMSIWPKWVLQPQKSELQFFIAQYLSLRGGRLQTPSTQGRGYGNG